MITLDGTQLEMASRSGWVLQSGSQPYRHVLEVDEGTGRRLFQQGKVHGSVLQLNETSIRRLTILGYRPTATKGTVGLIVSDFRWTWPYMLFKRAYNIRRRTGDRRRIPGVQGAIQDRVIVDDEAYAEWSIQSDGRRWSAREAIEDVLDAVAPFGWRMDSSWPKIQRIEGVDLDGTHDFVLDRLFSYFGFNLNVHVDYDGTLVLRDRLDGREKRYSAAATFQGPTRWVHQDRRKERPSRIHLYFSQAVEMRFNNEESNLRQNLNTRNDEKNTLENVIALPEDAAGLDGRDLVLGTWVDIQKYIAWLNANKIPAGMDPITGDHMQAVEAPGLESYIYAAAVSQADAQLWAIRVAALRRHYRRTYRISKAWMDRVKSLRPYRVAVVDVETNARAPATVYTDWASYSTWRKEGSYSIFSKGQPWRLIDNVPANPDGLNRVVGVNVGQLQAAPAFLSLVDEDQGVIDLDFGEDFRALSLKTYQSAFVNADDLSDKPDADCQTLEWGKFTKDHEVSVILTLTPGAPNDLRQFHKVTIKPGDVDVNSPADGPEMHIRISPTLTTARFGWNDDVSNLLEKVFSNDGNASVESVFGKPLNFRELRDVSQAMARSIYARLENRLEGSVSAALSHNLPLAGAASKVAHAVAPDPVGSMTTVEFPVEPPRVDFEQYLPAGTRRLINRMTDP